MITWRSDSTRWLWGSTLVMLVIAAWVIRQWPDRGLWYDETVNAYFAEHSWADIWEWCTKIDNQMPLDFALRKLWGEIAGTGEFSLRAFSVIGALLSAAGVIALGRRVGGSWIAGWLAALALALSQGFLYAAFEVRPYALLLALFAWASVVFWDLLTALPGPLSMHGEGESGSKPDSRYWRLLITYLLLALALLYTHYTAFVALAAHGVYAVWLWWSQPAARRRIGITIAYLGLGFALGYAPWVWALAGRDVRAGTAYAGMITPGDALQAYTEFYVFGQRIVPPDVPPYVWGVIGVIVFSLLVWIFVGVYRHTLSQEQRQGLVFAAATLIMPLAGLLLMVYSVQPKLSGRHGWPLWIGASVIMGAGLTALHQGRGIGRWLRVPLWIGALSIIWLPARADLQPVYNSYFQEAFTYINDHAEPGDVLILRDGTLFTAASYYDVVIPWQGFPPDKLTNVDQPLFFDTAIDNLTTLIEEHDARRIWVVAWQGQIMDPQNLVAGMLDEIGEPQPLENTSGFGDVTVTRYVLHGSPDDLRARIQSLAPVIQTPGGGPILLGGYVLNTESVPHGGSVQVHTWWQRGEVVMPGMRISMRLYDAAGNFYAPQDQPPVTGAFGQEHWRFDVPVLSQITLTIPPEMSAGPAEIKVILYDMQGAFKPITLTVAEFTVGD
ncbi:MAG: hypothetical protein JXA10_00910 [Anaerolineae bacterium]|nr:hypothetical protein [Anaerolineae bacterium]